MDAKRKIPVDNRIWIANMKISTHAYTKASISIVVAIVFLHLNEWGPTSHLSPVCLIEWIKIRLPKGRGNHIYRLRSSPHRASISKSRISVPERIAVSVKSASAKSCRLSSPTALFFRFTSRCTTTTEISSLRVYSHTCVTYRESIARRPSQSNSGAGARWCISRGKTDASSPWRMFEIGVHRASLFCSAHSRFALVNSRHTVGYFYLRGAVAWFPCTLIRQGCKATNVTYCSQMVHIANDRMEFN